jgi:hypothetical protein
MRMGVYHISKAEDPQRSLCGRVMAANWKLKAQTDPCKSCVKVQESRDAWAGKTLTEGGKCANGHTVVLTLGGTCAECEQPVAAKRTEGTGEYVSLHNDHLSQAAAAVPADEVTDREASAFSAGWDAIDAAADAERPTCPVCGERRARWPELDVCSLCLGRPWHTNAGYNDTGVEQSACGITWTSNLNFMSALMTGGKQCEACAQVAPGQVVINQPMTVQRRIKILDSLTPVMEGVIRLFYWDTTVNKPGNDRTLNALETRGLVSKQQEGSLWFWTLTADGREILKALREPVGVPEVAANVIVSELMTDPDVATLPYRIEASLAGVFWSQAPQSEDYATVEEAVARIGELSPLLPSIRFRVVALASGFPVWPVPEGPMRRMRKHKPSVSRRRYR